MKLFDIPNDSKIVCNCSDGSSYVIFKHIDGMYSLCITEKGNIVHLFCGTELEQQEDGPYIIKEEKL
jgi:hypothetical protein